MQLGIKLADKVNAYVDQNKPWELAKKEGMDARLQDVCTTCLQAFRLLSLYLKPVLPALVARVEGFLAVAPSLAWAQGIDNPDELDALALADAPPVAAEAVRAWQAFAEVASGPVTAPDDSVTPNHRLSLDFQVDKAFAPGWRGVLANRLMQEVRFDAVRGNISEIKTLCTGSGSTKGVDADAVDAVTEANLDNGVQLVKTFAAQTGCIIAVTGAIDLVSDGERCWCIRNGRAEMSRITGTGCQLSALMTAFLVANPDRKLDAAAATVCMMGLAGEIGWANMQPGDGNSTYRNRIIDAIFNMTGDALEEGAKYELR